MPININSLYLDVLDDLNKNENGYMSVVQFNRYVKRAGLDMLKVLTGEMPVSQNMPMPFDTQKLKDYLYQFFEQFETVGDFVLPSNYYNWQYLYKLGVSSVADCETGVITKVDPKDKPIPILSEDDFNGRKNSFIEGLQPTGKSPIACITTLNGNQKGVKVAPTNSGSIRLVYVRYPIYGELKTVLDTTFNQPVYDPATSIDCEFNDYARNYLVWNISGKFLTHIREQGAKQLNMAEKPTI